MSELTVRQYTPDDATLMNEWWWSHDGGSLPINLLPPVGVVVMRGLEAVAACWLYLAAGIGVCWIEYPVSRPGLSLREAREAFGVALGALEEVARAHDYGVMIAHTLPGIARALESFGFQQERRHKVTVLKVLNNGH